MKKLLRNGQPCPKPSINLETAKQRQAVAVIQGMLGLRGFLYQSSFVGKSRSTQADLDMNFGRLVGPLKPFAQLDIANKTVLLDPVRATNLPHWPDQMIASWTLHP